jgi:hypothetical protein
LLQEARQIIEFGGLFCWFFGAAWFMPKVRLQFLHYNLTFA